MVLWVLPAFAVLHGCRATISSSAVPTPNLSVATLSLDLGRGVTLTPSPVPSPVVVLPTPGNATPYRKNCIPVDDVIRSGILSSGAILLHNDDFMLYALNTQDNRTSLLIDTAGYQPNIVSPDGKWLAYEAEQEDANGKSDKFIKVISSDGQLLRSIPKQEHWRGLNHWLDAERIVMDYWFNSDGTPDWQTDSKDVVVNVVTGETVYMDFSALDIFSDKGKFTSYDSTLTRMVYLRNTPGEPTSMVLWDLKANQELWRMEIGDQLWYIHPRWSPDGMYFAIGGPPKLYAPTFELFVVGLDGGARQLTHLKEAGFKKGEIYQPQWSPDQRYIAFWFAGSLSVFDVATGITTDHCLPSPDPIGSQTYWSPDSKQLVFNLGDAQNRFVRVVVVDVQENWAVEVAKNHYVTGWMTMP